MIINLLWSDRFDYIARAIYTTYLLSMSINVISFHPHPHLLTTTDSFHPYFRPSSNHSVMHCQSSISPWFGEFWRNLRQAGKRQGCLGTVVWIKPLLMPVYFSGFGCDVNESQAGVPTFSRHLRPSRNTSELFYVPLTHTTVLHSAIVSLLYSTSLLFLSKFHRLMSGSSHTFTCFQQKMQFFSGNIRVK